MDKQNQIIYDKNHLIFTTFNHPKKSSALVVYSEFKKNSKSLSHYHFFHLHADSQPSLHHQGSYHIADFLGSLTGDEELLLFLESTNAHDVATIFYRNVTGKFCVGAFQVFNEEMIFTELSAIDDETSAQLKCAGWSGPYHNLFPGMKNIFLAFHETVGIQFYHYNGNHLERVSQIKNGQSFGYFLYEQSDWKKNKVAKDPTSLFEVITPYDPNGQLSARDVLMFTSQNGVHFLAFDTQISDFVLIAEDLNFFENPSSFIAAVTNYMRNDQPDLLLFRDNQSFFWGLLINCNGNFVFKSHRIPLDVALALDIYCGLPAQKSQQTRSFFESQSQIAMEEFQYPLTFIDKRGTSSFYLLNTDIKSQSPFSINYELQNKKGEPPNENLKQVSFNADLDFLNTTNPKSCVSTCTAFLAHTMSWDIYVRLSMPQVEKIMKQMNSVKKDNPFHAGDHFAQEAFRLNKSFEKIKLPSLKMNHHGSDDGSSEKKGGPANNGTNDEKNTLRTTLPQGNTYCVPTTAVQLERSNQTHQQKDQLEQMKLIIQEKLQSLSQTKDSFKGLEREHEAYESFYRQYLSVYNMHQQLQQQPQQVTGKHSRHYPDDLLLFLQVSYGCMASNYNRLERFFEDSRIHFEEIISQTSQLLNTTADILATGQSPSNAMWNTVYATSREKAERLNTLVEKLERILRHYSKIQSENLNKLLAQLRLNIEQRFIP